MAALLTIGTDLPLERISFLSLLFFPVFLC